jgi:hypothetical protein
LRKISLLSSFLLSFLLLLCSPFHFLSKVPGISIATDIICGFPGETEEEFEETLDLVERYKFPIVNISQFYPRPGTPAAKMKRGTPSSLSLLPPYPSFSLNSCSLVPTAAVKDRSRRLTRLFESYKTYDSLVGTEQRIWITELASDGKNLVGHTKGESLPSLFFLLSFLPFVYYLISLQLTFPHFFQRLCSSSGGSLGSRVGL